MTVKLALPTGELRAVVGELLHQVGIPAPEYESASRVLRATDSKSGLTVRVFRERDIPIQVALGNYHVGICSDLWLAEQQVRFPLQHIVRVGTLPGPETEVWVAAAESSGCSSGELPAAPALREARIASELPNLADLFAVRARIPGYRLIPIHGSAEAYPPEDAELVVIPGSRAEVISRGLVPLHRLYVGGLSLIANVDGLGGVNLATVIDALAPVLQSRKQGISLPRAGTGGFRAASERSKDMARIALPDGHAQPHTFASLAAAGLAFDGYDERSYVRRPRANTAGLEVKVVRPQDMPSLVALGFFDIAITGLDLLREHQSRFPGSPVEMAVDLGRSRYKIGPVVESSFPADRTAEALEIWHSLGRPVRIASEFPALAETFARDYQLVHTHIMPIAGASEGFVPEDADILIEGTETGASLRANGLKMLDPFMVSTNCAIVRRDPITERTDVIEKLLARFQRAAEQAD